MGTPALMNSNVSKGRQILRIVTRTVGLSILALTLIPTASAGDPAPATPCTLNCPADMTLSAGEGQCSATVNYAQPTTNGDCQGATVQCSPPAGAFDLGTTTVHCVASDATGQSMASCSFKVTVQSSSEPVISYPANVTVCA